MSGIVEIELTFPEPEISAVVINLGPEGPEGPQGDPGAGIDADTTAALAGTSGTPNASNRFVTNADARNTDARAPTTHATTHDVGGADAVTEVARARGLRETSGPTNLGMGALAANRFLARVGSGIVGPALIESLSDRLALVPETTAATSVADRLILQAFQRSSAMPPDLRAVPYLSDWGAAQVMQQHIGLRKFFYLGPGGSTLATLAQLGAFLSSQGTHTIGRVTVGSSTYMARQRRWTSTGTVSANISTGWYDADPQYFGGDAAGLGGFYFRWRALNWPNFVSGMRALHGLLAQATALSSSAEPSAALNGLWVGYDSTDTQLQVMHNDGSGVATKVALGSDFTLSQTLLVDFEICVRPAGSISWRVSMTDPASAVTPASGTVSSNYVATSTFLSPRDYAANGSTGVSAVIARSFTAGFELSAA